MNKKEDTDSDTGERDTNILAWLCLETAGSQFPVQLPALRGGLGSVCSLGIERSRGRSGDREEGAGGGVQLLDFGRLSVHRDQQKPPHRLEGRSRFIGYVVYSARPCIHQRATALLHRASTSVGSRR
ncbi:hypothetical protein EYF80_037509 [Liparis tanakae]|uniref:Uncharacterized protein n=1 Tax=Liparis tanakae TaxID=230148 RepID=A0A4Z2GHZ2_9TELE|nr:hypothetical protein EYF80_037509 [Liparis tanakae]